MSSSNSIVVLNQLQYDVVHKLACAANNLGARHIKPIRRWPWSRGYVKGLMGCDVCARNWVAPIQKPAHADWCPVGRTQEAAQEIIKLGSQPLPTHIAPRIQEVPQQPVDDSTAPKELQHLLRDGNLIDSCGYNNLAYNNRIIEAFKLGKSDVFPRQLSHERSDGRTERRRASGDSPGGIACSGTRSAHDHGEPLAVDMHWRRVVDRYGAVVVDLVASELTVEEQLEFGERIVTCVNYLAGNPTQLIREAAAARSASAPCNGVKA